MISEDEAIEILTNVRRLAEVLIRADEEAKNECCEFGARVLSREQREGYLIDAQLRFNR